LFNDLKCPHCHQFRAWRSMLITCPLGMIRDTGCIMYISQRGMLIRHQRSLSLYTRQRFVTTMKACIFILLIGGAIAREVTVPTSLKISVFGKLNILV